MVRYRFDQDDGNLVLDAVKPRDLLHAMSLAH